MTEKLVRMNNLSENLIGMYLHVLCKNGDFI